MIKVTIIVFVIFICSCANYDCSNKNINFEIHKNDMLGFRVDSPYFIEYVGVPYEVKALSGDLKIYKFKQWGPEGYCYWSAVVDPAMKMIDWKIESGVEHCIRECRVSVF